MEITSTQIINEFVNSEGQLNESTSFDLLLNEDLAEETLVKALKLQLQLESLEEQIMMEAGMGFGNRYASFISRMNFGVDNKIEDRVKIAMGKIKTQKDKDKLLKLIDSMIETAKAHNIFSNKPGEGMTFKGFIKTVFKTMGARLSVPFIGDFLALISPVFIAINNAKGNTSDFIETLKVLRKDVEAVKVPKE